VLAQILIAMTADKTTRAEASLALAPPSHFTAINMQPSGGSGGI